MVQQVAHSTGEKVNTIPWGLLPTRAAGHSSPVTGRRGVRDRICRGLCLGCKSHNTLPEHFRGSCLGVAVTFRPMALIMSSQLAPVTKASLADLTMNGKQSLMLGFHVHSQGVLILEARRAAVFATSKGSAGLVKSRVPAEISAFCKLLATRLAMKHVSGLCGEVTAPTLIPAVREELLQKFPTDHAEPVCRAICSSRRVMPCPKT